MSTSDVDTRIVSMQFENSDFISKVKDTISKLKELDDSLVFKNAPSNLDSVAKQASNVGQQVQTVEKVVYKTESAFSALQVTAGIAMYDMLRTAQATGKKIVNALYDPIVNGGKRRALNIENAKFQIQGLGYAWEDVEADINYGVKDTAYGLDSAARVAAQLLASGVSIGDDMKTSLRSISGVAAMTNSSYDEIGSIFTTIASNGKLMTQQLRQLSFRGLNAAAVLANAFGKTEQEINQMVSQGKISFAEFAAAMDDAFGEHAKKANETFTGAMSNVRAALARIGAKFATPAYEDLRQIFVQLIPLINLASEALDPLASVAEDFGDSLVGIVTELVETEAAGRALVSTMLMLYTWIRPFLYALVDSIGPVGGLVEGLLDLSKSMEELQLTGENAEAVYWVFRQIFDYIVDIVNGIGAFIKLLKPFGAVIRAVFMVAFVAFATLARLLAESQPLLETISKLAVNLINIIGFGLAGALYVIGELIKYIIGTGDAFSMLKNIISTMAGSVDGIDGIFGALFDYIRTGISSVAESFDGISDSTWKTVIAVALTIAGVTGMVMLIIKAFSALKKPVTRVASVGESVFGGIDDIVHGITSVTKKAGKVLDRLGVAIVFASIGYALNAIVEAFETMADLDWTSVKAGIPYILGALVLLGGFFALATVLVGNLQINVNAAGALLSGGMLVSLSLLLWAFVGAFAALTAISWDRIKSAAPILAVGFAGLIYFLSIVKAGMKATIAATPALFGMAAVMVSLGHAFMSLAVSVILLTMVDWDKLSEGYVVLGFAAFVVITLVGAMRSVAAICMKKGDEATRAVAATSMAITSIAKALFFMASSLGVFAISLQMLSHVNYEGLEGAAPWLIGFGTAMYLITVGLLYVCHNLEFTTRQPMAERINAVSPILSSISKSLIRLSFAILPLAVGLMLLAKVKWSTLWKYAPILLVITVVLGALAVFLTLFSSKLGSTTTHLAKADKQLKYTATRASVHYGSLIGTVVAFAGVIVGFSLALIGIGSLLGLIETYAPTAYANIQKIAGILLKTLGFIATLATALMIAVAISGGSVTILDKSNDIITVNVNQIFKDTQDIVKSISQLILSVAIIFVAFTVMVVVLSTYEIDPNAILAAIVAFLSGVAMLTLAIVSLKELLDTLTKAIVMNQDDVGARTKAVFNYLRSMMSSIVLLSAIVLVMEAAVVLISWLSKVHGINVNYMVATAIQFFVLMYGLKLSLESIYAGVEVAAKNFGNNYDQIIKSFWSLAGVLISVAIATAGVTAAIAYFTHVMNECEDNMAAVIMPLVASIILIGTYLGVLVFVMKNFETVTEKIKGKITKITTKNLADDALVNFSEILFRLALAIALVEAGMLAVVAAGRLLGTNMGQFFAVAVIYILLLGATVAILKTLNTVSTFAVDAVNSAVDSVFSIAWRLVKLGIGIALMTYLITLVAKSIADTGVAIMESASKIEWGLLWQFIKLLGTLVIFGFAIVVVGLLFKLLLVPLLMGVTVILGVGAAVTAMSLGIWSLVGAMTALGEAANNPVINDAVTGVITIVVLLGQIGATIAGAGILGILTAVGGPLAALSIIGFLMLGAIVTLLAASIVINVVADKIPETMEKFTTVTTIVINTLTALAALLDPVYMDVMNFTSTLVLIAAFLAVAGIFLAIAGIGLTVGANLLGPALDLLEPVLTKLAALAWLLEGMELWSTLGRLFFLIALPLAVAGVALAVAGTLLLVGSALALAGVLVLSLFVDKLASIVDTIPLAMIALGLVALLILEFMLLSAPLLLFTILMAVIGPLLAVGGLLLMSGMLTLMVAVMLMTPVFEKLVESIPVIEGATEALWALAKFGVSFLVVAAILAVVGVLLLIGGVALAIGAIALLISVASLTVAVMILGWMLVKLVDMIPLMQDATKALDPLLALIIKLGEVAIAFLIVSAIFLAIGVMFGLAAGLIGLGVIIFAASIVALVVIIGLIYLVASNLLPTIQSAFEAVVGVIGGIIDGIQNGFEAAVNAVASFVEAGANIVSGIVDGITSGISSAVDAITDLGNSIVDGFCDLLDINSPSEVFAEIGRFICEGLGIGIEENSDTAVSAAEDMGSEAADAGADAATEPSIWDRIVGFFTDTFGDAGIGGAFSLGEGFADSLPNLLGEFAAGGQACGQAFGDAFMAAMGMSIHDFGALQTANYYEQQAAIARGDAQHAVDVASEMSALNAAAADARARFGGFSVDDFFGELDLGGGGMSGIGGGGTTGSTASAIAGSSGPGSGINDKSKIGSNNNINSNNTYNYVQNNYSPEPLDRTAVYMQTQRQLKSWGTWNRVHG